MVFEQLIPSPVEFIREHESWAAPLVFALAFAESFPVLSLLFPATVLLVAIGALIGTSGIGFWPIWVAAAMGATLGDAVSYWVGQRFNHQIWRAWPLSRSPGLWPRARAFFDRWGVASVFLGRFCGPLRAVVPLVAGACAMPFGPFQVANVASALIWAAAVLVPGTLGVPWIEALLR